VRQTEVALAGEGIESPLQDIDIRKAGRNGERLVSTEANELNKFFSGTLEKR